MIIILLSSSAVQAIPPKPTEFYGAVRYFNAPVVQGAVVRAYDPNGTMCGIFATVNSGYYGTLTCLGDDPDTPVDEGAEDGDTIIFTINIFNTTASGSNTWSSGSFRRVDLVVPEIICGDGYCDLSENCVNCPADCGTCPSGDGDSDSDGDGDTTPSTPWGVPPSVISNYTRCYPRWVCTEWSVCYPNGTQYRTCHDENECNNNRDRPSEVQECDYLAHCFDGIKNYDETGIDCGGSCGHCPIPRPIQKQNLSARKLPIVEYPGRVCVRVIDPLNPYLLFFIAIVLVSIFVRVIHAQNKIKKIKKDKTLSDLEKAKLYLGVKRRMYLFIITLLVLAIFLIFYYYYFGICREDNIKYLWLLFALLIIAPIIIHRIMKLFEYTDEYKEEKYEKLLGSHYKNMMQLIDIENEHLLELGEDIAKNIVSLSKDEKFRKILEKYPEIKKIHRSLLVLFDNYREKKNPFSVERSLCMSIKDLEKNKEFLELVKKEPRIKQIFTSLKALYKQYEEKQHLYDEVDEIEHPEKYVRKHERKKGSKGKEESGAVKSQTVAELPEIAKFSAKPKKADEKDVHAQKDAKETQPAKPAEEAKDEAKEETDSKK